MFSDKTPATEGLRRPAGDSGKILPYTGEE